MEPFPNHKPNPPPIGITMGCPVGIGPEIIIKFFAGQALEPGSFVVLGDQGVLRRTAAALGLTLQVVPWRPGDRPRPGTVPVLPVSALDPEALSPGQPTLETGRAMAACIEKAVALALGGELAGIVTCPITKSALNKAGYPYPGHTEMLAQLCGAGDYAMMMAGHRLRVTLVTIHTALATVAGALRRPEVERLIRLTGSALQQDFGIKQPRLAVAGFNPHGGEDGLFGDEEETIIAPAVQAMRAQGFAVDGPLPPDTVFVKAAAGDFDAVVCMYHDQGLIPFKLLHFADGVNVTLGLPIVRTSVDHGTAYDIAGQGVADPTSLREACRLAARIGANRLALRARAGAGSTR